MGSAKQTAIKQAAMGEEKKSIKDILKKPFQAIFNRRDKRKNKTLEKDTDNEKIEPEKVKELVVTPVTELLNKLSIKDDEIDLSKLSIKDDDDDDEFKNFSCKVIDDVRCTRLDSHKSDDSGYSEKVGDSDDEKETKVDDKKKKKVQTVAISRAPIQNKHQYATPAHPYTREADYRQISQINKQTFSGGQVLVNDSPRADNTFLNQALQLVDTNVREFNKNTQEEQVKYWQMAEEFINEKTTEEDLIAELLQANPDICQMSSYPPKAAPTDNIMAAFDTCQVSIIPPEDENPIEDFESANLIGEYDTAEIFTQCIRTEMDTLNVFPTPPRSENVPSPMSDTQSYYPSHSPRNYTLSPGTSSPMYNSDYERYQDIAPQYEYPSVLDSLETENDVDAESTDKKARERTSMTLKQYKDMQKDIAAEFSKMECCQANRKTCKELFQGHLNKLKMEHRKMICQKVACLDLGKAYGVLQHIIASLSNGETDENLQLALFSLICEKVLSLKKELFVGEFGLNLLKAAVLRCPSRPLMARYLVQCIRTVTRADGFKPAGECLFTEVDAIGDNLVIACARGGDAYALALYELVARRGGDVPLFALHHANADGYTALHVACSTHSAKSPRTHIAHVLLEHAGVDLWREDIKGGETALHLAVNSANCDLRLIMIIFKNIDRKLWKKLAHAQNRSSVTPLEYARSASKSSTRQNFPIEVLEFLKKCR
ncbi:uncharacterized protein LOC119838484 [Zerene cesonia]|uniref:uncharacterized protein LOC119838484 n=1 Tax=Zerene cesonia TaxID=33412 RepID=UPI0018E55DC1|nr:uncharacterized protein LOC119838484 [Zerene cesonia]XP_038220362.1 uncharacterized protein LOC119838484 [Zerene cesonia]